MTNYFVRLALLCLIVITSLASDGHTQATSRSFYIENDVLLRGKTTDRNYTGGFGFSVAGPEARGALPTQLLRLTDRIVGVSRWRDTTDAKDSYSLALFGSAFTPETIRVANVQRGDRPYGSIFGVSAARTSHDDKNSRYAWTSQLVVGALGLDISKNTQSELHRFLRRQCSCATPYAPRGWANQISNGGELTGLYRLQYQRLIKTIELTRSRDPLQLEAIWDAEGSAGYYTNAAGGGRIRVGLLHSQFWEFNAAPLTTINQRADSKAPLPFDLFVFGSLRGRAVAYNALLQGERRQSVYTIASDSVTRGIMEHDVGLSLVFPVWRREAMRTRRSVAVTWIIESGRSHEFAGSAQRGHRWGAVHLTYFPSVAK